MLPARTTLLMLVLAAGGCTRRASPGGAAGEPAAGTADAASATASASPAASASLADDLPDVANGFSAGPLERGPGYVRRTYRRGAARITLTIGEMPGLSLEQWVRMSASLDYPPAALDAPPDAASGFWDCAGAKDAERCDLHAHTRGGLHIEVQASGTATRADIGALMVGIPMRAIAARTARP